jgi:DNA-binding CsgD family transcriptional regulator
MRASRLALGSRVVAQFDGRPHVNYAAIETFNGHRSEVGCGARGLVEVSVDREGGGRASVVGRDAELSLLDDVLRGGAPGGAVVLIGDPGIGKTTLWDASIEAARGRGVCVLAARSSGSEAQLPFAGLIDLCEPIKPADLTELPSPQRSALEAALLRAQPSDRPVESTAIALGLLGAVRSLAERNPVLIAIDDLQWLDQPSGDLLAFLTRRLAGADVRFLLARRPTRVGALEQILMRQQLERLRIGGLSLGAVRRLLFERLGLTLSRQLLRRIVEVTEGNPLFALEVGRSLVEFGTPSVADEIPLPDTVEELFSERLTRLPAAVRRVLLAVALSADPTIDQVAAITDVAAIDDAVDAGVVTIDGGRVRASHPLLAATARRHSRARERRELHLALAAATQEEQLRTLHLALATARPDAELSARLAAAAEDASARGARRQAVSLAGHALRLTQAAAAERPERVMALAERLDEAGELPRLTALLEREIESLPIGALRARAWLLLGDGASVHSIQDQNRYLERAVEECGTDHDMRAALLGKMAGNWAAASVERLSDAEKLATDAVRDATDGRIKRDALYELAWPRVLTGRPVDDLCEQSRVADDPAAYVSGTPERVAAKRLMWRGEIDSARELLSRLAALADARGEPTSYAMVRLHLCELETRIGNLDAASRLLDEWAESSDFETQFRPQYQRCRAALAAARGEAGEAVACRWDELEALRARGTVALLEQSLERAVQDLRPVWEHCEREGVLDPGAFPVGPELVEALVELGELDAARAVTERLELLAQEQEHPWATAGAKRCRALVILARDPHDEGATALLRESGDEFDGLGLRFDAARCLLVLGRAQRRAKRWRAAREALEAAADAFSALQATGWADRARAELARVGARRPRADSDALTPSEQRVVQLAAEGLANKQIASTLYVTVNTVEVHLARAYAKLGVHSRSQLARALVATPGEQDATSA